MLPFLPGLGGRTGGTVFTVSVSPPSATGSSASSPVVSNTVTAIVTNGSGSQTYLWDFTDGNPDGLTIDSPTSASTKVRIVGAISGTSYFGNMACTVTDAGVPVVSSTVPISLDRF